MYRTCGTTSAYKTSGSIDCSSGSYQAYWKQYWGNDLGENLCPGSDKFQVVCYEKINSRTCLPDPPPPPESPPEPPSTPEVIPPPVPPNPPKHPPPDTSGRECGYTILTEEYTYDGAQAACEAIGGEVCSRPP